MVRSDPSQFKNKSHLQVGVITKPHGVRGEVKVRLFNEDSEALLCATHIVVEPERGEAALAEIVSVRGGVKGLILALSEVQSVEQAERLRGAKLWASRDSLPPLAPGEYYLVDLVGCQVKLAGKVIAEVQDVRPDPSVDTMILKMVDGAVAEVPIVDAWVGTVDVKSRQVELLSEDGIIL